LLCPETVSQFEKLYVRDVYNLSLNADLVVLSACEAGIGQLQRGEGIISLSRAFAYAGAKGIVTTLWSVNDESTKDFMLAFYRHLQKMPRAEALHQARLEFLNKRTGEQAHPYYWAGFIGVGDM
jgi:CHAT domain-containing protein